MLDCSLVMVRYQHQKKKNHPLWGTYFATTQYFLLMESESEKKSYEDDLI